MTTYRRNDSLSRYEAALDEEVVAFIDFTTDNPARVAVDHTETIPRMQGHGLADELTSFALEDLRVRNQRVVAHCPYTRNYLNTHPEFADLRY